MVPESAEPGEVRSFWPWQAPLISRPKKKIPKVNWYLLFESLISSRLLTWTLSHSLFLSVFLFFLLAFFLQRERPAHPHFLNSKASISPLIFPHVHCNPAFLCSYSKVSIEQLHPAFCLWETTTCIHKYCSTDHSVNKSLLGYLIQHFRTEKKNLIHKAASFNVISTNYIYMEASTSTSPNP